MSHTVVFFIFLVSNIGGRTDTARRSAAVSSASCVGVDFFWTTNASLAADLVLRGRPPGPCFFAIDSWLYAKEGAHCA